MRKYTIKCPAFVASAERVLFINDTKQAFKITDVGPFGCVLTMHEHDTGGIPPRAFLTEEKGPKMKSSKTAPKTAPKTDELIALICKAATEKYSSGPNGDRVRPGIQIAHIPAEERPAYIKTLAHIHDEVLCVAMPAEPAKEAFWYVALHRYPNPRNGERYHTDAQGRVLPPACPEVRVVVHTAKHEDLDRAVQLLALQLLPVEAQAELAEAIRGVKGES